MKKVRQKKMFSTVMVIAFLATSTLACAVSVDKAGDYHSASSIHPKSDSPHSSDQQIPFEEKEKELEDRDDVDDKSPFNAGLSFICGITSLHAGVSGNTNVMFNRTVNATCHVPFFISHHTFLI